MCVCVCTQPTGVKRTFGLWDSGHTVEYCHGYEQVFLTVFLNVLLGVWLGVCGPYPHLCVLRRLSLSLSSVFVYRLIGVRALCVCVCVCLSVCMYEVHFKL